MDTYLAVIDSLIAGLSHRLVAYEEIHSLFGFFAELRDIDVKTVAVNWLPVEFYLYPTVGTVLIHSVKPELTE